MNNVSLVGRLTKDPEVRYTQANNTAVAGFTLAVNRRFKQDGQPDADFVGIVAWQKTAEFCGKYFKKGQQVWVCGRIQTRTWDDTEGVKHYVTEVVADAVGFADSKKEDNGAGAGASGSASGGAPAAAPATRSNPQNGPEPPWAQGAGQAAAAPSSPPPQSGTQAAFPWVKGGA